MNDKKVLAGKNHWDDVCEKNFSFVNFISNTSFFRSYYHLVLFSIIGRYVKKNGAPNVIEIGCAPGNYMVKFRNIFNADVFGVEYSKNGYQKTIKNLANYEIPPTHIFLDDFFNELFLERNKERYDIIFSAGFIEHFDRPEEVVEKQIGLTAKNGLIVCLIPNRKYLNALFSTKKSLAIHNRKIMELEVYEDIFKKNNLDILYCNYLGGILNMAGFLQLKNPILKITAVSLFVFQKIIIDNFQKIYFKITGVDLVSKYSSPSLICIARKNF